MYIDIYTYLHIHTYMWPPGEPSGPPWLPCEPWGNTNRVVSNRVVSKGPLYPSKTQIVIFCFLIRPRLYASDMQWEPCIGNNYCTIIVNDSNSNTYDITMIISNSNDSYK